MRMTAGFTDLVEDSQVLTLQRSGLLSETLKGNKKTDAVKNRRDTVAVHKETANFK